VVRMSLMLSRIMKGLLEMFALSGTSAANFGLNSSVNGMKIHSTDGLSS
jgi:hypothetical protein